MSSEATAALHTSGTAEVSSPANIGQFAYAVHPPATSFEYFTERYYHQFLVENCKNVTGNNCRVLQHSNGLCVLCLDHSHVVCTAVRAGTATVTSVTFGSGKHNSNTFTPESVQVAGKRKKNALICQSDTRVCAVTMSYGTTYTIPACVNGFVLELNAALLGSPWLVATAPTTEGFIAVITPNAKMKMDTLNRVWTATGGDAPVEEHD